MKPQKIELPVDVQIRYVGDREPGIGWNNHHPVDLQMLLNISRRIEWKQQYEQSEQGARSISIQQLLAEAIREEVEAAQRGEW